MRQVGQGGNPRTAALEPLYDSSEDTRSSMISEEDDEYYYNDDHDEEREEYSSSDHSEGDHGGGDSSRQATNEPFSSSRQPHRAEQEASTSTTTGSVIDHHASQDRQLRRNVGNERSSSHHKRRNQPHQHLQEFGYPVGQQPSQPPQSRGGVGAAVAHNQPFGIEDSSQSDVSTNPQPYRHLQQQQQQRAHHPIQQQQQPLQQQQFNGGVDGSGGANAQLRDGDGNGAPSGGGWFSGLSKLMNTSVNKISNAVFGEQPSELVVEPHPIIQSGDPYGSQQQQQQQASRSGMGAGVGGTFILDPENRESGENEGGLYEDAESGVMVAGPSFGIRQTRHQNSSSTQLRTMSEGSLSFMVQQRRGGGRGGGIGQSSTLETSLIPVTGEGGNDGSGGEETPRAQIQFNIVAAIRQYRRNPVDALFSLVKTALTARSMTNLISGAELKECRGDNSLLSIMISSVKLDYEDTEVVQELNEALDNVLQPKYCGRLAPEAMDLLQVFLTAPCVRLTAEQRSLIRRSGYEFVILLEQYPHTIQNIPPAPACRSQDFWSRVSMRLEPLLILISLSCIYCDSAMISYRIFQWYEAGDDAFYISLLVLAGGTMLCVFANKLVNASREEDFAQFLPEGYLSQKKNKAASEFPSPYLRVVPILPLFETNCAFGALKKCCEPRSNVGRHDLIAMFTNSALLYSMFYSTQQILTQSYFVYWRDYNPDVGLSSDYLLLLISTSSNIFLSPLLYLRAIVTYHSVNSMGFTFFGPRMPTKEEEEVSKFARVLSLLLVYLMQFNLFMLLVAIFNVSSCSTLMIVWMSLSGAVVLITIIMFVHSMVYTKDFFKSSKFLVIPTLLQLGYTVFVNVANLNREEEGCRVFFAIGAVNIVFGYIGWGLLGVVVASWGGHTLYKNYQKNQLREKELAELREKQRQQQQQSAGAGQLGGTTRQSIVDNSAAGGPTTNGQQPYLHSTTSRNIGAGSDQRSIVS